MRYSVRRFSFDEGLSKGREYVSSGVDTGLGTIEDISTRITEDPRLKDLRPVKRHGRFIRNISKLLRKKKKQDQQNFSEDQTINTSEANKFKTAINRLTSSMGSDSQSLVES